MKQKNFLKFFIALLFTSVFLFTGCERKTDDADRPADDTLRTDTTAVDTSQVMNLQGNWRGTLDGRPSTFNITEFKDNNIKGTITTTGRQTATQQVEGTFVPETRVVKLSDQVRSRFMGTYSGTISEDGTTLSGTFTGNTDKNTAKFNYKKEN